ncbi:MAG: TusE/DsrC/DsvC family sulfur relay protein [Desulfobulbaceae bacterium]|nr:MAG: TusE/DsrC/DsvC family sulfur relay protein [Desulfobulbaceae bacterium]
MPTQHEGTGDYQPVVRSFGQREVVFDSEGFFNDFNDWTEEICTCLAAEAGLGHLDDRHWLVIRYLREYYGANGRAPLNNALRKGTGMALLDLEALFPGGIRDGARRLAGLPNPKTCS